MQSCFSVLTQLGMGTPQAHLSWALALSCPLVSFQPIQLSLESASASSSFEPPHQSLARGIKWETHPLRSTLATNFIPRKPSEECPYPTLPFVQPQSSDMLRLWMQSGLHISDLHSPEPCWNMTSARLTPSIHAGAIQLQAQSLKSRGLDLHNNYMT